MHCAEVNPHLCSWNCPTLSDTIREEANPDHIHNARSINAWRRSWVRIRQVHRDLRVLHPPRGAGVLALHGHCRDAFFTSPVSSMTSTAPGRPRCSNTLCVQWPPPLKPGSLGWEDWTSVPLSGDSALIYPIRDEPENLAEHW
jgi:hypothetical protein